MEQRLPLPPFTEETARQKIQMAYGNENWEFDENGLMAKRFASINDLPIAEQDRRL